MSVPDPSHLGGGFFSRWSQRKRDAQAGKPLAEVAAQAEPQKELAERASAPALGTPLDLRLSASHQQPPLPQTQGPTQSKQPTLAEAQQLTPDSDFQPFMTRGVASEVRNAALKKLFSDPHFNVMDGLDIYIGDYHSPDPLPPEMLRQMVGAKNLALGDDPESVPAPLPVPVPTSDPDPKAESVSAHTPSKALPASLSDHDHTDLRLQPDPTSADFGTEPGAG